MTAIRHVCLLTSSYPADYSRFLDREARSLFQAGFKVTVIGLGNKFNTHIFYSKGIKVIAVPERWQIKKTRTLREIARLAWKENADVYHCIDPWCLAIGLRIKTFRPHIKVVYESSEWFPRQYLDRTDLPLFIRILGWLLISYLEYQAVRKADAIIETNRLRALRFRRRRAAVNIVPNYAPLMSYQDHKTTRNPWFIYTGLICRPRGFDRLLTALGEVKRRFPEVKLIVRGEFDPRDNIEQWVESYIKNNNLENNIQFVERVDSYEQVFELLKSALCGVILLQPGRGNDWTNQPSKLFEFMVAGLAIVASNFPEIARIINDAKCGWLIDPTRPEEIARTMEQILSEPDAAIERGEAGRKAAESRYNWRAAEEVLLRIYGGLSRT